MIPFFPQSLVGIGGCGVGGVILEVVMLEVVDGGGSGVGGSVLKRMTRISYWDCWKSQWLSKTQQ